jgi:hypothetical protein
MEPSVRARRHGTRSQTRERETPLNQCAEALDYDWSSNKEWEVTIKITPTAAAFAVLVAPADGRATARAYAPPTDVEARYLNCNGCK